MFAKTGACDTIDMNVGGIKYTVNKKTLLKDPRSNLYAWFKNSSANNTTAETPAPASAATEGQHKQGGTAAEVLAKDADGRYFIDRDGQLFGFVLDYLRNDRLVLPEGFTDRQRLLNEAQYFNLQGMIRCLAPNGSVTQAMNKLRQSAQQQQANNASSSSCGHITIGYQGSFSFGRQGLAADVNFRKINRILVCGRVSLCREVFGDSINEGRDPDRGHQNDRDRYTARYYLKHNILECAFDKLAESGFELITSCASGTSGVTPDPKTGSTTEEDRWAHYNEFVFYRGHHHH